MSDLYKSMMALEAIKDERERAKKIIDLEKRVLFLEAALKHIVDDVDDKTSGFLNLSQYLQEKDPSISKNSR